MKRTIISALLCLSILSAGARQSWTLDSCINYALAHNISVASQQLQTQSAELSVTEAKDRFLPNLDAGASQIFDFGRGLTSDNTYADRNTSQFGWNVSLQLPLFQGLSAKRQLDYAKASLKAMLEKTEAVRDDVELQVISLYLQVLYTAELHEIALEQVRITEIELESTSILVEAGKVPELDLTQVRSQLAQVQLTAVTTESDHRLALLDLAHLLRLEDFESFEIAPLSDTESLLPSVDDVYRSALVNNHALRAASLDIDAARRNIALQRTGYIPRLSLNAGLGSSYYNISGIENQPFHRQMRDNFNKSLGFTLSIPIFDAFSTRNAERRARIELLNSELQYEDTRSNLFQSIQQAYQQALSANAKVDAATVASEAARQALEAMQEKYNFGRATATEFEQAKSTYIKALAELTQAKYEAMLRGRILMFYNRPA
ncbi:MAG: TolC family protein [Bacteroides sp.]|nr:TolC family protein [Bacteroides sp.]MCM1413493.1 TolC family protein [Bacteroides sp.]MCM1471296.1 TolC family protein [Bacteroides sp.]